MFQKRDSYGRSKYRVRRYGTSADIFLERKLRNNRLLSKRRTLVDLSSVGRLAGKPDAMWPGHWFHRRLIGRQLRPVCQLSYVRTARVAMTPDGLVRLTLDRDLRAQPANGLTFHTNPGRRLLDQDVILELKYRVALPAMFKHLVEEFKLRPIPISKYRLGATVLDPMPAPELTPAVPAASMFPDTIALPSLEATR